jgi:SAM-dependent methyltransferase
MERNEYITMHRLETTHWWFAGKRFLVTATLDRCFAPSSIRHAILDIGCGTGMMMQAMESHGRTYGLEVSPDAIRLSKQRGLHRIVRSNAGTDLPFKNAAFDAVTCLDVLEHLDDDRNLIKEIFRVVKPGGYVIVTVPAFQIQWSRHDVAIHHKRRYTKQMMLDRTAGYPWRIRKASYFNMVLFLPILAIRKARGLLSTEVQTPRSDFALKLPGCLNDALSWLMITEIKCLRCMDFPFGVSFVLVLHKCDDHA